MSRELMDESYYVSHGGKIPVKWTAPEVSVCKENITAQKYNLIMLGSALQEVLHC